MDASRTGRPKARNRLDRERIVATAITLADRDGLAALTMRKLGDGLGVEAMSLYNHVANKVDLTNAMADAIFAEIELPSARDDWKIAIRKRSISFRDVIARHPWAITVRDSGTNPGLATLRHHDRVLGTFLEAGFSMAMTAHAISVVDSYIYGFAMQEKSLPFTSPADNAIMAKHMLTQLPVDEFSYLANFVLEHVLQTDYDYGDEFLVGLDLVLDSLEQAHLRSGLELVDNSQAPGGTDEI